jgi:hypothetical protein
MGRFKGEEKCVVKKTGDSYTVWFPPSQSFVLLKGPAYDAFRLLENGGENETIITALKKQTGSPENEILDFLIEMRLGFDKLMNPANLPYIPLPVSDDLNHCTFSPFAIRNYLVNGSKFRFDFGSNELFQQFHPLISHLCFEEQSTPDFRIELFSKNKLVLFRLNGKLVEHFSTEYMHFLKGSVLKKMAGLIYSIPDHEWMASLHASAVSDGKRAILFTAQPGGGKSTIAALLQANGFSLLSDDFIMLDNKREKVWKIPLSVSVKEGSLNLLASRYPELKNMSSHSGPSGKQVYYLTPIETPGNPGTSYPVKTIVFIQYSRDVTFKMEKVKAEEALMSLLAETWVNPNSKNVKQFLEWAERLDYYRLTYSDHNKALEKISNLFRA